MNLSSDYHKNIHSKINFERKEGRKERKERKKERKERKKTKHLKYVLLLLEIIRRKVVRSTYYSSSLRVWFL